MTDTYPQRQYWAFRGTRIKLGPYESREAAIAAFRAAYPAKPAYAARRDHFATGYGIGGAHFDIRWHRAEGADV